MYVFKKYRFLLKNTGLWASKYRFVFPEVGMSAHGKDHPQIQNNQDLHVPVGNHACNSSSHFRTLV